MRKKIICHNRIWKNLILHLIITPGKNAIAESSCQYYKARGCCTVTNADVKTNCCSTCCCCWFLTTTITNMRKTREVLGFGKLLGRQQLLISLPPSPYNYSFPSVPNLPLTPPLHLTLTARETIFLTKSCCRLIFIVQELGRFSPTNGVKKKWVF